MEGPVKAKILDDGDILLRLPRGSAEHGRIAAYLGRRLLESRGGKRLPPDFTGMHPDSLGRKRYYVQGKLVKGPQEAAAAIRGSGQTANNPLLMPSRRLAEEWVAGSPGLTDEHRKMFSNAMTETLEKLTPGLKAHAVAAISAPGGGIRFYASMRGVADAFNKGERDPRKRRAYVPGFVSHRKGGDSATVHLNGGTETGQPQAGKLVDAYLHEMGHAADVGHQFSGTPEWQSAWRSELKSAKIPQYNQAKQSPSEGFAEVVRFIGTIGDAAVRERLPKCHKFFKLNGLVP